MIPAGHIVFVLGSGFSASMGLPTLAGLFQELMALPDRPGHSDRQEVLYALELLYPHFKQTTTPPSYPPFEEFLSLVTAAEDLPFFSEGYWEAKRHSALRLLTDCLVAKSEQAEKSPLLHEFVNSLKDSDVIITFNWDNLIERTLLATSRRVNFRSRDIGAVTVLKLHGSLNWAEIPEGSSLQHPETVFSLADRIVCTRDYSYHSVSDIIDLPPLIVPPISSKRVPGDAFLREIWHEAFNSLIDGERIAFIGYSIPKDDLQARSLLANGWSARILKRRADSQPLDRYLLIDPNPEVCGRYASSVSTNLIYHQAYFTDKLLSVVFGHAARSAGNG